MRQFILNIIEYVNPYLAKNGGPIILAQIENEYAGNDQAYVDWCGSLVSNELSSTEIPWIMCNGHQLIQQLKHVIHVIVWMMVGLINIVKCIQINH